MKKYVLIGEKDNRGKDEMWCAWYNCPNCRENDITHFYSYCPKCGIKLRWSKEK